jgi:large subunit ribosomal protein L21
MGRLATWRTPIYAIVRSGGRQYRVEPNQTLDVDRIKADVGSTVDLSVLMVGGNGDISVGAPEVDAAKVVAEVIEHGRDRKILVFKYKNKTRYRRRQGHRQDYTRLQIKEIVTASGSFTEAAEKPKAAPKRRRKAKEEPVAEAPEAAVAETPVAEAEAPEAEAAAETAEAKPKRATRKPKTEEAEASTEAAEAKPKRATRKAKAAETPAAEDEAPAADAEADTSAPEAEAEAGTEAPDAEEPATEATPEETPVEEASEEEK